MRPLLAAIAAAAVSAPAQAGWSVTADLEHFRWSEAISPDVTERGPLVGFGVRYSHDLGADWQFGYRGRIYLGLVDYDGAFLSTGAPAGGSTEYRGLANEVQAIYRLPESPYGVVSGLILDYWNRQLSADQREEYLVASLRLGVQVDPDESPGWFGGGGLKYPFHTRENAHLTDIGFNSNPSLEPKGKVSLYASLGYRFRRELSLEAYYDSYRFKASEATESITNPSLPGCTPPGGCNVYQPASDRDSFGLRLQYNFR